MLILSHIRFRKILFWLTTIFFGMHILITLQFILFNSNFLPSKVNAIYNKLIIIGPFFSDDRIVVSPHLYLSFSTPSGGWSPYRDVARENFSDYEQHFWRYKKLMWSDYERYIADKAYEEIKYLKIINGSEGVASNELTQYVHSLQHQADSIQLLYIWNTWQPTRQSYKSDTAFFVAYRPIKDEVSK